MSELDDFAPQVIQAFDEASIGMAVVALEGTFLVVNRALAEMFGVPADELRGRSYLDFVHPDEREQSAFGLGMLARGDMQSASIERQYRRADGREFWGL